MEQRDADATKVGIGAGKVCITKLKTGFGNGWWQLSAVKWCVKGSSKPIIADGGLRVNGDIAKSIRMGATISMIVSLFAAHQESPVKKLKIMLLNIKNILDQQMNIIRVKNFMLKLKNS
ncbi:MAG: IMP dehydrogenase [Spiroplasma phoeniceum]|nr:MAG: IMP dehydrogenase [Spiroplasma phoeniceum]UZQ33640.1 MAG: IMP dehydrogenase [Spiroplasma phoeniceum]